MTRTLSAVLLLLAIAACGSGCTVLDGPGRLPGTVSINGNVLPQAPKQVFNMTLKYTRQMTSSHPTATELARLCSFDVPMRHATMAVTAAEKARTEMPAAPSLTECSSDGWTKAKAALDRDHGSEAAWTALAARWAKVCPGP